MANRKKFSDAGSCSEILEEIKTAEDSLILPVCEKLEKAIAAKKFTIDEKEVRTYLGKPVFDESQIKKASVPGTAIGLAWTSMGGDTLLIESITYASDKGGLILTGQMGDVMKESAKIAVSVCRANADTYGIDSEFYKTKDLHIHAPEGAVPKDGPSAGITMTTALVSALSGIPVRRDLAMTGEISLLGNVLPIGGLKEKLHFALC